MVTFSVSYTGGRGFDSLEKCATGAVLTQDPFSKISVDEILISFV